MLLLHADTVMVVGTFGTGKCYPFAARKPAWLLLSLLKGPTALFYK